MTEQDDVEIITITQEDGVEEDFEAILYYENEETGIKYVFLVPADASEEEEQDVFPFRYAEEGDDLVLAPVEEDAEWEMLEEVLHALLDEGQI